MKPRATKADKAVERVKRPRNPTQVQVRRVFRAAMRLYRLWVAMRPLNPDGSEMEPHWYPLNSEREAKALCRACAAARPRSKASKPRGKR